MFSRSNLLRTFLFMSILLLTAAAAFAASPNDQPTASSVGIRTYLMPDLSLKSVFTLPELPLSPELGARKTCRCSCGTAPCATDADCGGGDGSCSHFISCCAKQDVTQWFPEQASRQTMLPAVKTGCD